ncbi:MAG: type II toxin-antitoxin system RelE family toxin [Anaerolineales bacterium]
MAYVVVLTPAAEREHRKLPREVREQISPALLALEDTPRPHGSTKLSGSENRWRIRVGDYRVVYGIDDTAQRVRVLRIAHRREVYR